MGDDDDGHSVLRVEALEHVYYLLAGAAVQVSGGLVGQQDRGLLGQRPGYAHPLLLAAGQLRRPVLDPVSQADAVQGVEGPSPPVLPVAVEHRQLDVLQRAQTGQQAVGLEDEPDLPVPDLREAVVAERADVPTLEPVHPGRRDVETTYDVHQGGLARARGTHDGHQLAPLYGDGDAVEGGDVHAAHPIDLGDLLDLYHWFFIQASSQ